MVIQGLWPDDDPKDVLRLCRLVTTAYLYHDHLWKYKNLYGVLVHGTCGTKRSACFASAYIGRQMWSEHNSVNLIAIVHYIRKYRHAAFTSGPDSHKQINVLFVVMEAIAKLSSTGKRMQNETNVK